MATLRVNTGLKEYEIEDEHGKIRGSIFINPSDANIYYRMEQMIKVFEDKKKELARLKEQENNTDEIITFVKSVDDDLRKAVNNLLDDDNASDIIFGKQNLMNTNNGVPFIERFIDAFFPVIKKEVAKEQGELNKKAKKYLDNVKKED